MTGSLGFFYLASVLVIVGGILVVTTRNIVYAAFALLVSMLGTAGVFLLAFAEFLAIVQILIYGGAVVIVVLFALMLTRIEDFRKLSQNNRWYLAAIASIALFLMLVIFTLSTSVPTSDRQGVSIKELGEHLFTYWAVPFEVASIVLLIALIGAIVLVKRNVSGSKHEGGSRFHD